MANGRIKTVSFGPGFLGAVLLFCGFAVAAWILFRFMAPSPTYEEKRAQERRDKVATINTEAQEKLYGPPKWIDKAKGTVQLPIDTAMDLVIVDYQQKPVQPSQVKVEVPYPLGLQTPPAAPAATGTAAPATTGTAAPATTGTAAPAATGTAAPATTGTAASPAAPAAQAVSPAPAGQPVVVTTKPVAAFASPSPEVKK